MADFCKQCSMDMFGEDFGDFKHIANKNSLAAVICEGCGNTLVNEMGECVNETCLMRHGAEGVELNDK